MRISYLDGEFEQAERSMEPVVGKGLSWVRGFEGWPSGRSNGRGVTELIKRGSRSEPKRMLMLRDLMRDSGKKWVEKLK